MAGTPCLCLGKIDGVCQRQQGPPFVRGRDCAVAYHYHNTPRVRAEMDGIAVKQDNTAGRVMTHPLPCVHEGAVLEFCTSCGEKEGRHVRDCDVYEKCTREFVSSNVKSCSTCFVDYEADVPEIFPEVTTRHLLYHLYPLDGPNRVWRWNVDQLCRRMDMFNGKRIVAVAFDPPTGRWPDPVHMGPEQDGKKGRQHVQYPCAKRADVTESFGKYADSVEFVEVENDPDLCELTSFDMLFGRLRDNREPHEAVFYGHSKGTTHQPGSVTRLWTEVMYEVYLDYWGKVSGLLKQFPVVGAFKKHGPQWPREQSSSRWHYSGSFLWARTEELFAKKWRSIDRFWSGIEPWPSLHFNSLQAGNIFHEGRSESVNLYNRQYWDRVVLPELEEFRAKFRRPSLLETPGRA